jgi:hypothetical protein
LGQKAKVLPKLHLAGKESYITLSRIQALESMEFDWGLHHRLEDRLSELADYRNIKHCNVPFNYSKKPKAGYWVAKQRSHYRLHHEGKKSQITLPAFRN